MCENIYCLVIPGPLAKKIASLLVGYHGINGSLLYAAQGGGSFCGGCCPALCKSNKVTLFILRLTVVVALQTSNIITAVVAVLLETLY